MGYTFISKYWGVPMNKLIIIVPCFNEDRVLEKSSEQLLSVLNSLIDSGKISSDSRILFVNDGSRDKTWEIISAKTHEDKHFEGLNLARNVGHQNALLAGIDTVKDLCDISITIDADLQDDISVMENMVDEYIKGADIVYGVRSLRKTDSFFKRSTAHLFYKFMSFLGAETVYNHADYRLMSSRAMKQLLLFKERNIFLRGIVPKIGYKTAKVYYERKKREAGKSKYPLKKMLSFAWDGITSLSIRPISVIMALGLLVVFASVIAFIYIFVSFILGKTTSGWTSLMASIWLLGGLQLFAIGVIGQYVGKTYMETKERPRYNIEQYLKNEDD